jgi:excisionase family DNA binding protein
VTGIVVAADEPLYTTAQVADRLQLPVSTIRGAIRSGRLRAYLPAGRRHGYRIAESAIQEFLRASAVANGQGADDAS